VGSLAGKATKPLSSERASAAFLVAEIILPLGARIVNLQIEKLSPEKPASDRWHQVVTPGECDAVYRLDL
jgi:hypothetical protein